MAKNAQDIALEKALRESALFQKSLADSTDDFKQLNLNAGLTGKEVENIISLSTRSNNLMKDTITLQSRIGKEYIKISSIDKEILKYNEQAAQIQARIQSFTAGIAGNQTQILNLADEAVQDYKAVDGWNKKIAELSTEINEGLYSGTILQQKQADLQQLYFQEAAAKTRLENHLKQDDNARQLAFLGYQKILAEENATHLESQKVSQKETNKRLDIQNNKLGSLGAIVKGISKIPILGNLIQTEKILDQMEDSIKKGGSRWKAFDAGISATLNELDRIASDPLIIGVVLVGLFASLVKEAFKFEKNITDTANSLALSKSTTQDLYKGFQDVTVQGKKVVENLDAAFISITNQGNALNQLNDGFGTSVLFTNEQVQSQIMLTKQMGMSVDEANALEKLALNNKSTTSDILKNILKQNDGTLSYKKVLSEVTKISGQLLAQYKNNPEELAKAVVQAQKLGITLEQAKKSSEFLLNFESSISAELEAELVTGKALNLEKARSLALDGKSADAAKEMLSQVGQFADFQKLNVIQQESLAKAVGMTTDELTNSLREQQTLKELGVQDKQLIADKLELYKKTGDSIALQNLQADILSKTNGDILLKNISQASLQQKFEESMERIKEVFVSVASGPLITILNGLAKMLEHTELLKGLLIASGAALAFMATKAIVTAGASIAAAFAMGNWVGAVAGAVPLAAAIAAGTATGVAVNDSVINPQGGIVISTPEGQIVPNRKDSIITTTDPKGMLSGGGNNSEMIAILSEIRDGMKRPGNVYLDSMKVGTAQGIAYNGYA